MRKLTLLTLLIFASFLYAEDEPIVLDKDILYWRPAGEDVQIPDFYLLSPVIKYGPDDYISPLFFPLERKERPLAEEAPEEELTRDEIMFYWTPPSLFMPRTAREHHNTLTLFASHPYGSGLLYEGSFDSFSMAAEANYSHKTGYPHWIKAGAAYSGNFNTVTADFGYRLDEGYRILPLAGWHFSTDTGRSGFLGFKAEGQGSFASGADAEYLVSSAFGGGYRFSGLTLEGRFGAVRQSYEELWFLLPELSLSYARPVTGGDWSLTAGAQAEMAVSDDTAAGTPGFYPLVEISYMDYGSWSLTLKGIRREVSRSQVNDFLVREVYEPSGPSGMERFAFYDASAELSVTSTRLQSQFEAGWSRGDFPFIASRVIEKNKMTNIYGSASFSWAYRARRVTELSCYADYQDKGSFRFFAEGRWLRKGENGTDLTLLVRGGNREILRGYTGFFDEDSGLSAGTGVEVDFSVPLRSALYLDYLPRSGSFEGRAELSFLF